MICFSLEKLVSRAHRAMDQQPGSGPWWTHGGIGQELTKALTAGCYDLGKLAVARETWRGQRREAHPRL
jgi:hypothetical protein